MFRIKENISDFFNANFHTLHFKMKAPKDDFNNLLLLLINIIVFLLPVTAEWACRRMILGHLQVKIMSIANLRLSLFFRYRHIIGEMGKPVFWLIAPNLFQLKIHSKPAESNFKKLPPQWVIMSWWMVAHYSNWFIKKDFKCTWSRGRLCSKEKEVFINTWVIYKCTWGWVSAEPLARSL